MPTLKNRSHNRHSHHNRTRASSATRGRKSAPRRVAVSYLLQDCRRRLPPPIVLDTKLNVAQPRAAVPHNGRRLLSETMQPEMVPWQN